MNTGEILEVTFVEDDEALGEATAQALSLEGAKVNIFRDASTAMATLSEDFPGVVVSDIRLPGMDGLEFFARLQELDPDLPVIFTTGHGDVSMAVKAMKEGASDFLTKPYSSAELARSVRLAAERRRLVLENRRLRAALNEGAERRILGSSEIAARLRSTVAAVAASDIDIVVDGEPGTGKSFIARLVHDLSSRQGRPFVTIDAGVLAHEDAELLIFGREPSAGLSRTGLIERANGGTLLLDEIEAASEPLKARLLSVLETRSVLSLGAERARKLNVRIIVAQLGPSPDGPALVSQSSFYQRLSAVRISLPPLSSRRHDISELFRFFVAAHQRELNIEAPQITEMHWKRLQTHDWPGNIRELGSYAREFVLGLAPDDPVEKSSMMGRSLQSIVSEFERAVLEDALRKANGNMNEICKQFGTPRKTLYDKLARFDLKPRDYRSS